mgnify:CR=1 FL=1
MSEIVLAMGRSLRTLGRGRVWLLFFGPAVVAVVVWIGLTVFALESLIGLLVDQPPLTWLAGWGAVWLAKLGAVLGGWLLILAAAFVTAMLLAAIFVMPLLLDHVALADYPELARAGKDSLLAGAWNSIAAVLLYAVGWLLTLPLWLLPGLGLLLPILCGAFIGGVRAQTGSTRASVFAQMGLGLFFIARALTLVG